MKALKFERVINENPYDSVHAGRIFGRPRGDEIVSYINSEYFANIKLLIRSFSEKINTKYLFSAFVMVLVIVIIQKK